MSYVVADILKFINDWAPNGTAQSYDNVGLQVGRPSSTVTKCLVALDLTPAIVDEAILGGFDTIVTHHPLIFKPISSLTDSGLVPGLALKLAEHKVALVAAHTNLDAARDGVSFKLGEVLGLQNLEFLSFLEGQVKKVVCFVPVEAVDAVRQAAHEAGGGQIGDYSHCSFSSGGTGQFKPGDSTSPFIGQRSGDIEKVSEVRLEMEVASWRVQHVIKAMRAVHPYQEMAYDLYSVEQPYRDTGIGAIGDLHVPETLGSFLQRVSKRLNAQALKYTGDLNQSVKRVAVCGGSGSDFISLAQKAGADAYVTADFTYHRFFETMPLDGSTSMALIDAGHYETEQMTEDLLVERLKKAFPSLFFEKTAHKSSPVHFWTSSDE